MNPDQLQAAIAAAHAELEAMLRDKDGNDLDGLTEEQERAFDRKLAELKALADKHAAAMARLRMGARLGLDLNAPVTGAGRGAVASGEAFTVGGGRVVQAHRHGEAIAGRRAAERDPLDAEGEPSLAATLAERLFGYQMAGRRSFNAMREDSGARGGFLAPGRLSDEVIDLARDRSILSAAGCQTLDLSNIPTPMGSFSIAYLKSDPVPQWRGEGEPIAVGEPTFGVFNIVPRSLGVIVPVTLELLADAPNVEQLLRNILAEKFSLALDQAGLVGESFGAGPGGVLNNTSIPHVLAASPGSSKRLEYSDLVRSYHGVMAANAVNVSAIYRPEAGMFLETEVDSTGQPLTPPPSYGKMQHFTCNALPVVQSDKQTSSVITADFSGMLLVLRQKIVIDVGYAAGQFESGQASFRALLRANYCITRPGWFHIRDLCAIE